MNTLKLFTPAVYRTLPVDLFDRFLSNSLNESNSSFPYVNIIEDNDKFQLELALPGYSKEQISMNYLKNVLTIKSNIEENTSEEKKLITREFGPRNFSNKFFIPTNLESQRHHLEF